ncbi:MAG TPA: methionine ABC transporter permease [Methylomusa anaerophila]|uniref:D-methionine transport system permease protein MetI n=1 Tax=Methylomusa anaerophila TaxID=1930071 RepID=A0A348ALF1_9FIRM|nr:methionine ABC transporter permease [Methylomusa anaerophila]BBB91899.1 D-methionine transport system permease protein MetI [Methylomusa anaerophila]HML88370.1 methionine ABC transporter permease [Methylomusa anaerophila]
MNDDLLDLLLTGLGETVYMVVFSTAVALVLGLPLGIILVVTEKGYVLEALKFNKILGTLINVVRSFPDIILIVVLLPLARFIVGTTLGSTAALVPLSIGAAPFIARIIENCLKEVSFGKIEAAMAIGANPLTIITKVLIPEALPSLIRGITIAVIAITGMTAVAGAIGAGGLGSLAIRFGYMRFRDDVMLATVVTLIILVQGVQWGGDYLAKYINRKRYKFD